jgi:hypothetical protein
VVLVLVVDLLSVSFVASGMAYRTSPRTVTVEQIMIQNYLILPYR